MKHAKRLACRNSSIGSVCTCTGFIGEHSYDRIDMRINLCDALKMSVHNLAA
jgi:hypothetical protein